MAINCCIPLYRSQWFFNTLAHTHTHTHTSYILCLKRTNFTQCSMVHIFQHPNWWTRTHPVSADACMYGCTFGVFEPVHNTATDRVFAVVKIATTRKMCAVVVFFSLYSFRMYKWTMSISVHCVCVWPVLVFIHPPLSNYFPHISTFESHNSNHCQLSYYRTAS